MPPTINNLPKIAFSRNPLELQLTSTDFKATDGINAIMDLEVTGAIIAGEELKLNWSGGNLTFVAALVPDDSGLQIPLGDGSTAHVAAIAGALRDNAAISRDFYVSPTLSHISLHAKRTGVVYNMVPLAATHFTLTIVTPGVNEALKPNFGHWLEIRRTNPAEDLLYSSVLALDGRSAGITTKDIAQIADVYLGHDIPALTGVWQACPNSVVSLFLNYAQYYGETPQVKRLHRSANITFCLGGYSNAALGAITDGADHLQKYLLPNEALYTLQRWFETFPVDLIIVRPNMPAFLYFINNRADTETLSIKVVMEFDTGTTQTITIAGGTLAPYQKVAIGCGYVQLGLSTYETGRKVTAYEVSMVRSSTGESRSQAKRFVMDLRYREHSRYFLYSDSCGNFKTLHTYGRSQLSLDISDNTAMRPTDRNTPKTGNISRFDIVSVENDAVNTGYIIGDHNYDALQELMLAEKAFRVMGDQLVPIIITTQKFYPSADAQNLLAAVIEYRLAYDERLYTGSTGALNVPRLNSSQESIKIS